LPPKAVLLQGNHLETQPMPRRKVTPFARFLLAIIIIVPLAFAGASYINGEDPISNFKSLTGMEATEKVQEAPSQPTSKEQKTKKPAPAEGMEALKAENQRLMSQVKKRDQAIKDLQEQLKNCQ